MHVEGLTPVPGTQPVQGRSTPSSHFLSLPALLVLQGLGQEPRVLATFALSLPNPRILHTG